ncbi:YobH family protein [Gibbsiella quercinecans]|uniref:YobH family protein n=1 Tax=Gibbsiella quercinecans TaxID=929813 RepID=UPI00243042DD|nr:YobH family protein [Gibbsiella quercinecans]
MKKLLKLCVLLALLYGALLFSGYGVLIGSQKNVAGLGLQCKYLSARNVVTAQYLNGENGVIGTSSCPMLKKVETVVD